MRPIDQELNAAEEWLIENGLSPENLMKVLLDARAEGNTILEGKMFALVRRMTTDMKLTEDMNDGV